MRCAVCDKESNNRRVCPYCFTPYPTDAPAARASTGAARQGTGRQTTGGGIPAVPPPTGLGGAIEALRSFVMRQTPVVRWSGAGILLVLLLWLVTSGDGTPAAAPERTPLPVAAIAVEMTRDEAVELIRETRESALVETQADEVNVSYPAADFPLEEEGQLTLARRFARADELVEGRRRRIFFYNPTGRLFAQSDAVTGLSVIR